MTDPFKNCSHHELINDAFCRSKKLFEKNNTCPFEPVEQICHISSYSEPIGHSKDNCYEAFFTMCSIKNEKKHQKNNKCVILEKSFVDWCTCEDIIPKDGKGKGNSDGTRDCVCFPYHVNPYALHKLKDKDKNSTCVCSHVFRKKCQLFKDNKRQYANISCITTNNTLPMEKRLNCSKWLQHHSTRNKTNPKVLFKEGNVWKVYNKTTGDFSTVLRNISSNDFNISNTDNETLHNLEMVEFDLDHLLRETIDGVKNSNETYILKPEHIGQHGALTNWSDPLSSAPYISHVSQDGASSNQIASGPFHSPLTTAGLLFFPFTILLLVLVLVYVYYKKTCKKSQPPNVDQVYEENQWDDILFEEPSSVFTNIPQTQPAGALHPTLSRLQRAFRNARSSVVVFTKDSQDNEILIKQDDTE